MIETVTRTISVVWPCARTDSILVYIVLSTRNNQHSHDHSHNRQTSLQASWWAEEQEKDGVVKIIFRLEIMGVKK